MRTLLLLALIEIMFTPVSAINGVIWDKKHEKFISIFSNPIFGKLKQEILIESRKQETHNFQGKKIKLSYYHVPNLFEVDEKNMKISGFLPELWYILAERLNFTLVPEITKEIRTSNRSANATITGLLAALGDNKTDVVPKVVMFSHRLNVLQYTNPIWKSRYRLYMRSQVFYDTTWMCKLFSRGTWGAFLLTFYLLCGCSFAFHAIAYATKREFSNSNFCEHFFHTIGIFCGQCGLPNNVFDGSRVLEFTMGMFAFLMRTALGGVLISHLARATHPEPFSGWNSLLKETSYKIIILKGSIPFSTIYPKLLDQQNVERYARAVVMNRVIIASTQDEMYSLACTEDKKYVIFEAENLKQSMCTLKPVGNTRLDSWVSNGLAYSFKFKRTIDIEILKLHETGIIRLLMQRWLQSKNVVYGRKDTPKPVVLQQVSLICVEFLLGISVAVTIFGTECLIYTIKKLVSINAPNRKIQRETKSKQLK